LRFSTHALSDITPAEKFQRKIVFQQTASGKCWHERVRLAMPDPRSPELDAVCLRDGAQIQGQRGAMFAFMAYGAISVVKFPSEFALALLDVATGTIPMKNSLPINLNGGEVMHSAGIGN
jgi:hypothetical protein